MGRKVGWVRGVQGGAGSKVNPSPRALIWPPTFSDADQLMNSTVTLATWKDNAVSMSHVVMEGNARGEETKRHRDTFTSDEDVETH